MSNVNYNFAVDILNDESREPSKEQRERALVYSNLAIADAIKEQTETMQRLARSKK